MVLIATIYLSATALGLLAVVLATLITRKWKPLTLEEKLCHMLPKAPGPKAFPLIGSMHLLGQHEVPFEAFTALSKIYGDIYSITLGSIPCVVVNNFALIKEVLITKGAHFGGRPDFIRFHKLFGGDRNNCKY